MFSYNISTHFLLLERKDIPFSYISNYPNVFQPYIGGHIYTSVNVVIFNPKSKFLLNISIFDNSSSNLYYFYIILKLSIIFYIP